MVSVTLGLVILLAMVILVVSKKTALDQEKLSPFECGFSPKCIARERFSIQFFLVALIFLIFDIELVLIFPAVVSCGKMFHVYSSGFLILLIILLSLGLILEWSQKMLNWVNL